MRSISAGVTALTLLLLCLNLLLLYQVIIVWNSFAYYGVHGYRYER
jgi:hypothetical protein